MDLVSSPWRFPKGQAPHFAYRSVAGDRSSRYPSHTASVPHKLEDAFIHELGFKRALLHGLRHDADVGLGRLPTLRILLFRFIVGDGPGDDYIFAIFPIYGRCD